jgi:hypothetical protein
MSPITIVSSDQPDTLVERVALNQAREAHPPVEEKTNQVH